MGEYTRSEIIDMHYAMRDGSEKIKLIDLLLSLWDIFEDNNVKLKTDLIFFLDKYSDKCIDGPFIILMTMRNRKDLSRRISAEKTKNKFHQLKSFLKHLEEQQKNIYTPDECIRALLSSSKYAEKKNLFIVFEIERVRRIRAKSTPSNQNLNVCLNILETLEPEKGNDDYGGIYIPSDAVEGLIQLQKSLTYARTFHFQETLESSQKARDIFNKVSNPSYKKFRNILIWWTHVIEARTYSKCYLEKEALDCQAKANNIRIDGEGIDKNKQKYLNTIVPKKTNNWEIFQRLLKSTYAEQMDFLHAYHELLANYIARNDVNVKKAFTNKDILKLLTNNIQSVIKPREGVNILREKGVDILPAEYKREFNQFLTRGVIGGYNKEFKPQPLLFDHSSLREKSVLSKRMVKNCTITVMLAQTSHERQNSLIILQLSLIIIDLLTKNRWLAKIIIQRINSRPKKPSRKKQNQIPIQQKDEYENHFNHAMMLTEICVKRVNNILKSLSKNKRRESPLETWVNCCAETFPKLARKPEKDLPKFVNYCESRIVFGKKSTKELWEKWESDLIGKAKENGFTEKEVKAALEELELRDSENVENRNKLLEKYGINSKEPESTCPINLRIEREGITQDFPFYIYLDSLGELSPYQTSPGELKFTAEGDYLA